MLLPDLCRPVPEEVPFEPERSQIPFQGRCEFEVRRLIATAVRVEENSGIRHSQLSEQGRKETHRDQLGYSKTTAAPFLLRKAELGNFRRSKPEKAIADGRLRPALR